MAIIVCMTIMAQSKFTTGAMLRIAKEQTKSAQARSEADGMQPDMQRMRLVVKIAPAQAADAFARLREAGAQVLARIGNQAVVSVPVDAVGAIECIDGVLRIDTGHKPKFKTDVTRRETGVSLLNGASGANEANTSYTGKGVTVCLFDIGVDFQHPAFKDSEGNTRIKCVYMIGDEGGHKFTYNDPDAGEITFPGSVYDTPELIATLTTDTRDEAHGTHTAGIAAGSLSPLGYGGMAPEADIVLITVSDDVDLDEDTDENEVLEQMMAFVAAYAEQSDQPLVFSCSANSHDGPHNGTGTVPEAIEALSAHCIPVFSAGNEGGYPIHLHKTLASNTAQVKALLMPNDETDEGYVYSSQITGYTRTGEEMSVQLNVITINAMTGRLTTSWSSEKLTITPSSGPFMSVVKSDDDAKLSKYFDGVIGLTAETQEDGKLAFSTMIEGETLNDLTLMQVVFSGAQGTEFDAWESMAGFYSSVISSFGDPIGDSEMSGGDWTSTPNVISVGAYCANETYRSYDGSAEDDDEDEEEDYSYTEGDYAWFSSYGTMFNGVQQPVVSAPGVNIVSSWNHYTLAEDETILSNMQWQGYPYSAESGTSMSCPVVSGIIALWLQARPDLTLDDVKRVLQETSGNDAFTLGAPERFGFGKINAAKGIKYLLETEGISNHTTGTKPQVPFVYDLQGRRIDSRHAAKGIYLRDGRKYLHQR